MNSEIDEDMFDKHSDMSGFIPANENVQKENLFITKKLSDENEMTSLENWQYPFK